MVSRRGWSLIALCEERVEPEENGDILFFPIVYRTILLRLPDTCYER
jgi:hypothetical protein